MQGERRESFMLKKVFATSAFLSAVLGMGSGSAVWAKPPDLPVENRIQCPEGRELPRQAETTYSVEDLTGAGKINVEPATIDSVAPVVLTSYFEQLWQEFAVWQAAQVEAILRTVPFTGGSSEVRAPQQTST